MARFATDFAEYTTGQQPSDWTEEWSALSSEWNVEAKTDTRGGKVLEHTATASARRLLSWDAVGSASDAEITSRLRTSVVTEGTQNRIYVRTGGGSGTEDAYFAELRREIGGAFILRLSKHVSGGFTVLGTVSFAWQADAWIWIRMQAIGTAVKAKAWIDGYPEPGGWLIEVSDSDLASGGVGVGAFADDGVRDFDFVGVGTAGDRAPISLTTPASRQIHARLEILRSDDATTVDVTDWLASCAVELGDVSGVGTGAMGGDGVVRQMTFSLHNQTGAASFAPLDRNSSWNQFAAQYDPLIWPMRQAIFYVATQGPSEPTPVYPDDYMPLFQGYIGDEISTSGSFVQVRMRDLAKRLQDTFIEPLTADNISRVYAEANFQNVEFVMQQIIDDNVATNPPQIFIPEPIDPAVQVKGYRTEFQSVWDAIQDLAAKSGLWLGYRVDPVDNQFKLTLLQPPRDKDVNSPDFELDWEDDFYKQDLDISDRYVRNAAVVEYTDESGERQKVTAENATSITEFGRRALQIEEGSTSGIRSATPAQRLADFAVQDLGDLHATTLLDMPLQPRMDVFAGVSVTHPRVSSQDEFYGVESVRHSFAFDGKKFRTSAVCAGRVVGAHIRWMRMQARTGAAGDPTASDWPIRPNTVITVAASDASYPIKRRADLICDGIDDQEEIQLAINRVSTNGKVQLSEGIFHISDTIEMPSDRILQGQGNVTVLRVIDNATVNSIIVNDNPTVTGNENVVLADFSMDGNKAGNVGTGFVQTALVYDFVTDYVIARLRVFDFKGDGISVYQTSDDGQIEQCVVRDCDQVGFWVQDSFRVAFNANTVRANGQDGMTFVSGGDHSIVGNPVSGNGVVGINMSLCEGSTLTGNTTASNGAAGINLSGVPARGNNVSDNTVRINGGHGIQVVDAAHDNQIMDNNCEGNGTSTDLGFDNIFVAGGAESNELQGNTCRRLPAGNRTRYGINIAASAGIDNFVTNNDLKDGGHTGDLNIDESSTITAPGNRLTSGSQSGTVPAARVRKNTITSVPNQTPTAIDFTVVQFEQGGTFWNSGNPTRLVVPEAGVYAIGGNVQWAGANDGFRELRLNINGGNTLVRDKRTFVLSDNTIQSVHAVWQFNAGDYIEMIVNHNFGQAIDVTANAEYSPSAWMAKIGG